jgi:hypothetical protein
MYQKSAFFIHEDLSGMNQNLHSWYYSQVLDYQDIQIIRCKIPYFSVHNVHLMYNAHPKLFRHSFFISFYLPLIPF